MTDRSARFGLRSFLGAFALAAACAGAAAAGDASGVTLKLDLSAGLNYETADVLPKVDGAPGGATLRLVATDPVKGTVSDDLPIGTVQHQFEERTAGRSLVVDGYVMDGDGATVLSAVHDLLVMGNVHDDNWLHEDVGTYTNGTGTGVWSGTNYVTAADGKLQIDTSEATQSRVACEIGSVPSPYRGYAITTEFSYQQPSYDCPDASGERLGLTVAAFDETNPTVASFAFVTNGAWCTVPVSVCDPLVSKNWQVHISVDSRLQEATYYVRVSSNESWTVLGTATSVGSASVTTASFCGMGALSSMNGNGFDTQLIDVELTFDAQTLYPGLNFEESIVTGRLVYVGKVHDTDRTTGTYSVRLVGSDGSVFEVPGFEFSTEDAMEFYVRATDLTPGVAYRAEVVFDDALAEPNELAPSAVSVMGRELTNELWGVYGSWVYENAQTFDGEAPGTGDWTGRAYAETEDDWILLDTCPDPEDPDPDPDAALVFLPTNQLGEAASCYVAGIKAVFTEPSSAMETEDAVFGLTVSDDSGDLQFACLSNRTWQTVPLSVATPTLGAEYELSVYVSYVQGETPLLSYLLTDPSGVQYVLMSVELEEDLNRLFDRVEISGTGKVTDLSCSVYSTDLLRFSAEFNADALEPGTNFTASTANGVIRFTQLWDTDRTNGELKVVLYDKYNRAIGQRRISFTGVDQDRPFEYYITGLTPGETYTVKLVTDMKGYAEEKSDYARGTMAQTVTNGQWAASGWIREDVETFVTNRVGTGDWLYNAGEAVAADDFISINTAAGDEEASRVRFSSTNALPRHTGLEFRTCMVFDIPRTELPTVDGKFGITVMEPDPEGASGAYRFMILDNGVWTDVDPDIYAPQTGVVYEVTIRVDCKRSRVCYLVRSADDESERPVVLADFDQTEATDETAYQTDFYGVGRVQTHEGDAQDVTLVEFATEFDPSTEIPGTNFAAAVASGILKINQVWEKVDKTSGHYTIIARDAYGQIVATNVLGYAQLTNQNFSVLLEGLEAGRVYDIEVVADLDGEVVSSSRIEVQTGRRIGGWGTEAGGWIHENPATFSGEETGTGLWSETNGTTSVVETDVGRAIRIDIGVEDPMVAFTPTNDTLSVRKSSIREIRLNMDFSDAGWLEGDAPPTVPSNTLAAVTVWCDDTSEYEADRVYALAVISTNGAWTVLHDTSRRGVLNGPCTVAMLIDLENGLVRYSLETETYTNKVHQYEFEPEGLRDLKLKFNGSGDVLAVDGDVWDANLIGSSTNEFADLNTAILGTLGENETLYPLWMADQFVDALERGEFRVDDPKNWLNVRFPWWYYYEVTTNGSVRIFRFNSSNNWIDYAADGETNIVVSGSVFLVKTAEGLSWLAAQATNAWISGRIELATNIDLTAHNWTPIAGFTGTFDGKGHAIRGLNNSFHNPGRPGGEYVCGPTNGWGRSAYGLFGTATNATLTGVIFSEVAISNLADSVAALAGALAGNCAVSNVTVESGSIRGLGGTVAGLAGLADFNDSLTVINSTNRAAVTAENEYYGEGRWAAGLLCVAGPTDPAATLGTVVVTNNVNTGTITNVIYDADLFGGNVAQILAGTTPGARFGEVHLTNNVAAGSVEATLERSEENVVVQTNFPAVNLASAFWGFAADGTFYRCLDGNRTGAVAVDPVNRTARMLSGTFPNGTENPVGLLNDEISALLPESLVTMPTDVDSWGPIVLDRDLTFDLGGHEIYTVYVNNTFVISNGVAVTVRNGTIKYGPESQPFVGDTSHLTKGDDLKLEPVDDEFYERTTVSVDGEPISGLYSSYLASVLNTSGTYVELYPDADVTVDVEAGELKVDGRVIAKLSDCYGFKTVKDGNGEIIGFEVKIVDSAAPTADFTLTGGEEGSVSVNVGNAKEGFWYVLQHKSSLAEEWITPPADEWVQATADGAVLTAPTDGNQGYYRVLMSDRPEGQ